MPWGEVVVEPLAPDELLVLPLALVPVVLPLFIAPPLLVSEVLVAELLVGPVLPPPCAWLGCASANEVDSASTHAAAKMVLVMMLSLDMKLTNRAADEAFLRYANIAARKLGRGADSLSRNHMKSSRAAVRDGG